MPHVPTVEELVDKVNSHLPTRDGAVIRRAYEVAEQAHRGVMRDDGTPYICHCLATADILADLGLDPDTVAAGLLHDTIEDTPLKLEEIQAQFGDEIAHMVDGVTKLTRMGAQSRDDAQNESLRKMFVAMAEDVRVVLIKLADRLHNMRTLGAKAGEAQERKAKETMDIYAPLANRLGIGQIKWELEDLSFRYLDPKKYYEIREQLAVRRVEREKWVADVIETLREQIAEEGIQAQISGRPKHIYSIYRKMQRKDVPMEQIYDLHAVRVLVNDEHECYAVLGIVHKLWTMIPGEFDDYISRPKGNNYRSLHTAIIGPGGRPVEVQIRTFKMHEEAEYGVAAHWRYKEGGRADPKQDQKIAWLRQLLDWRKDVEGAAAYVDALKSDVLGDKVYVFTPKGKIIELPIGSTPIDFAYHIHTEVGDHCRGAMVNGKLVSLNYQLHTGDRVEIRTAKQGGPSRDWLNENLGYVKSARAREKIRNYFRRLERDQNIRAGREMLEKELKRLGLDKISYESIAKEFKYDRLEDLLAAIGDGTLTVSQIATRMSETTKEKPEEIVLPPPSSPAKLQQAGATIDGLGNLWTRAARCCNPVPGEEVVGFVTAGRGVTLHRPDCPQLGRMDPDRLVRALWPRDDTQMIQVAMQVVAMDRPGLVRDIADVVAKEKVNMTSVRTDTNRRGRTAQITAVLEVSGIAQFSRILDKVRQVPNVLEAQRV
ncbi:MAG: bifunctional (p)ppGpp synthetase/guanosine-3',5'-bis(diphosphate) 3'-pyrophosphohydrolase [Anaerolineae bacterium]|nr:bifunctional (p)ppGpp synthetase/guanosine-3',5'-bis(diphosphate) 3'-pyrophosphohydrolase [Anaerolineae bacterium]